MKAKTDSGPTEKGMPKPDYIENLFALMRLVSHYDMVAQFETDYENWRHPLWRYEKTVGGRHGYIYKTYSRKGKGNRK
jgi:hypothetical protein